MCDGHVPDEHCAGGGVGWCHSLLAEMGDRDSWSLDGGSVTAWVLLQGGRWVGGEPREEGGPGTKEQESLQTSKDNYLTCESEPKDTRINKLKSKRLSQRLYIIQCIHKGLTLPNQWAKVFGSDFWVGSHYNLMVLRDGLEGLVSSFLLVKLLKPFWTDIFSSSKSKFQWNVE